LFLFLGHQSKSKFGHREWNQPREAKHGLVNEKIDDIIIKKMETLIRAGESRHQITHYHHLKQ